VHLRNAGVRWHQGRDDAALERFGDGHDIGGLDLAGGGFGVEPVPFGLRCSAVTATPQRTGAAMWAA
jgi:hypothetical protein